MAAQLLASSSRQKWLISAVFSILFITNSNLIFSQSASKYYLATNTNISNYRLALGKNHVKPLTLPYQSQVGIKQLGVIEGALSSGQLSALRANPNVYYIEEAHPVQLLSTPNDPGANQTTGGQAALLKKLEAYAAWDSAQGDTSIMIAILDNGIDYSHQDMAGNLAVNHADPINGKDDDNNGFVDDYYGYDLASKDADPKPDAADPDKLHGTQVACIAAASTHNGIGIAGLAYKCRYLAVKVFGASFAGYEGIIYAADRGAKVINLSWGGNGYPAQFEQDVIDYAVKTKGAVVVAAAGNTPGTLRFYPASYKGVISVGFTDLNDGRNTYSTLSPELAVMAPGTNVFGITGATTYANMGGGSSFSAPMVAALAGLVRAKFPTYTPDEVKAKIESGADRIDTIPSNRNSAGILGKGRVNFRKTLTSTGKAYVSLESIVVDPTHSDLKPGIAPITINLKNHLAIAKRVSVVVRLLDSANSNSLNLGGPGGVVYTDVAKGQLISIVGPSAYFLDIKKPLTSVIALRVLLSVDGDTSYQSVNLAPGYLYQDLVGPQEQLTLASNGRIGYVDEVNSYGSSFLRLGRRLLGEGGLIIAQDSTDIRDNITAITNKDNDFSPIQIRTIQLDSVQVMEGLFSTPTSTGKPLSLQIGLKAYAWPNRADRHGLITEHTLVNTTNNTLDSIRFGLYADWDINKYWLNQMRWDSVGGFGYAYAYGDTAYAALVPLSPNLKHGLFAIDAVPVTATGNIDVTDGFSRIEKSRTLFRERRSSGGQGGTNSLGIHHSKLPSLAAGAKQRVAYAWIGGPSLAALRVAAKQSLDAYKLLRQGRAWPITNQFSNFLGDSLTIQLPSGRWAVKDSAGNLLANASGSFRFKTTKLVTSLLVQELDSLFPGPEAVLTIKSRFFVDSLPRPKNWFVSRRVPLPPSPAISTDSIQIDLVGLGSISFAFHEKKLGNIDSIPAPNQYGWYWLCRRIRTQEGHVSKVCDSVYIGIPVSTKESIDRIASPTPNPATSLLTLSPLIFPQEIWDSKGTKVYSNILTSSTSLSINNWPRGLYIWRAGSSQARIVVE